MRSKLAVLIAGIGLVVAATPVMAHHSFAAEYDSSKPITLKGTVTRVEWTNPHARFYVDVKEETRNSLKFGDQITVEGSMAKDGSKMANAKLVTLADGKKVFAGSPGGGEGQ
jgi:hypothetical protein